MAIRWVDRYVTVLAHAAIWLCFTYYCLLDGRIKVFGFSAADGSLPTASTFWLIPNLALFYVHALLLWPLRSRNLTRYLLLTAALFLACTATELVVDDRVYKAFYPGKYNRFFWPNVGAETALNFLMLGASISFALRLDYQRSQQEIQELRQRQVEQELGLLRAQLNPHFLFNTLNNLFGMSLQAGNAAVAEGLQKLAGLMRYMLYDTLTEQVELRSELNFVEDFLALQRLRFSGDDPLEIDLKLEGPIDNVWVPPLLVVTGVENALKHGVRSTRTSWVRIWVQVTESAIAVTVLNSYHTEPTGIREVSSGGIGLENLKRRLQLLYPGAHTFSVGREADYFRFHVTLQRHAL